MNIPRLLQIIQKGAYYDLLVGLPLALPIVSRGYIDMFSWIHNVFGLDGLFPFFTSMHMLSVNLLGILMSVWAWVRIIYGSPTVGKIDIVSRIILAATMCYYYLFEGISDLVLLFIGTEIIFIATIGFAYLGKNKDVHQRVSEEALQD